VKLLALFEEIEIETEIAQWCHKSVGLLAVLSMWVVHLEHRQIVLTGTGSST
jgi:hypothetical protein